MFACATRTQMCAEPGFDALQRVVDGIELLVCSGGAESAPAKAMNREFVFTQAVLASGAPSVHVPLVGIVDFLGRRVSVRTRFPVLSTVGRSLFPLSQRPLPFLLETEVPFFLGEPRVLWLRG